jgi:dihydrofolate reductase
VAKLVYAALASLDGYVADEKGNFDWAEPDEEVHGFVNDLERSVGTHLLGRRMHEVLRYWDTAPTTDEVPPALRDFATIWQATDKVVYSTTLGAVDAPRTRVERSFDPGAVRQLKATADRDVSVGGPALAAQVFEARLVDEVHLLLSPVVVGGGTAALPHHARVDLELLDVRRFGNGVVYLQYRVGAATP